MGLSMLGAYWKVTVTRGGCVMCRHFPPPPNVRVDFAPDIKRVEGHHILGKHQLKKLYRSRFDELRWDERNGMGLCVWHHQRHEHHVERVPRWLLPAGVFEFAEELDLTWLLDRDYPEVET